jgi:hypothetical protein
VASVTAAQIAVVPSLNATVPDGVPPLPVTVAVKVTNCPPTDGFTLEASAVTLDSAVTSNAPIEGGFGRVVPSKSLVGAPVGVPAALAGEERRMCKLFGAEWNSGSDRIKPMPVSPLLEFPKNRLSVGVVGPGFGRALSPPAKAFPDAPAGEPPPPSPATALLFAKILFKTLELFVSTAPLKAFPPAPPPVAFEEPPEPPRATFP